MELWKCFVQFVLFPFLAHRFATCSAKNKQCFWTIDAVQKDNLLKVASVIVPGEKYFLRIRVKCNDMVRIKLN